MSELPEELEHISESAIRELDVRPLLDAGEKPFEAIMAAADLVPEAGALKLIAPFKPAPLVRVLEGQGWQHRTTRSSDSWIVWFFRS